MNIKIENDSQFATHLYQTPSKSSMKSRLRMLETLKLPCFLKTRELNIDAFSMPQTSSRPSAFNNGLSPFGIENEMLTKLTTVSPDSAKLLMRIPYMGKLFKVCE